MEDEAEYIIPNQPRREYSFTVDFVVDLPAHLNPDKVFNLVHDLLVGSVKAYSGTVAGEWNWKEVADETSEDPG